MSLLCFSLLAVSSQAVVAFNTFGAGDSTNSTSWGFGDIDDTRIASQFSPSVSGMLDSFEMKVHRSGTAANATITLFEDSGNNFGTPLAVFTTLVSVGEMKTFTNSNPDLKVVAGNKYWIEAKTSTIGSGLYSGWSLNNQGANGLIKFGKAGSANYRGAASGSSILPAFRVNVTPVPEPTSLVAMGMFASFAALRRKKAK